MPCTTSTAEPSGPQHLVAVLALPKVIPFDLGVAARVFGAALDEAGAPLYEVRTCAIGGGPVQTADDYAIAVEHDETLLARADTIVVATQEPEGELLRAGVLDAEVAAALALARPEARIMSTCTGSFVLAGAGLLDGHRATTHWGYSAAFRRLFPRVRLEPDVLFVDNGRVLTSAGGAAAIDLCLHVVRDDHGAQVANDAARRVVVPPWRDGGQAQFIARAVPEHTAATTGPTRDWAAGRLREPLDLDQLAAHAGMSVRTFTRRFRAETGLSPNQWVTQQRVDRARMLLEETDLPVETIAFEVGFGSATLLRQHLRAAIGVAPLAYRRTFRGPQASAAAASSPAPGGVTLAP